MHYVMHILTNYELRNKDRIQCNSDKSNWIKPNVLQKKTISIDLVTNKQIISSSVIFTATANLTPDVSCRRSSLSLKVHYDSCSRTRRSQLALPTSEDHQGEGAGSSR